MRSYALAFLVFSTVFLSLDFVWLTVISADFYKQLLGHLLAEQPNLRAAAAFYVVYLTGAFYFAAVPPIRKGSVPASLTAGALFGLVAYATYDLTNMATLKGWPLAVTLADLAWGTFLTSIAAAAAVTTFKLVGAKADET